MKVRIDLESLVEALSRLCRTPESGLNHAGMKEQHRVFGAETERVVHGVLRILIFAVLVESPGQRIPGVDVVPYFKLLVSERERFRKLQIVVSVKECKIAVVQNL